MTSLNAVIASRTLALQSRVGNLGLDLLRELVPIVGTMNVSDLEIYPEVSISAE